VSLDTWLKKSVKVEVGGRELFLAPLPLARLVEIGHWLEDNCNEVVQDVLDEMKVSKETPNPLSLITKVLLRVNMSDVSMQLFARAKKPGGNELLNSDLSKEFFDEYLDIPTVKEIFEKFVAVNQLEDLIKNLYRLPIVKKVMEAGLLTYGIPYLNSLPQSMDSAPVKSEGSLSPKSTTTSAQVTSEEQDLGSSSNLPPKSRLTEVDLETGEKRYLQ